MSLGDVEGIATRYVEPHPRRDSSPFRNGVDSITDIHDRSCLLQNTEGFDERRRETFGGSSDIEVLQRARYKIVIGDVKMILEIDVPLGLCTPIPIGGHLELAKGVSF